MFIEVPVAPCLSCFPASPQTNSHMFTLCVVYLMLHGLHDSAAAECGNLRCETGEECTSLDCMGGAQCQMDCPLSRPQCPKSGSLVRVVLALRVCDFKCGCGSESSNRCSALASSGGAWLLCVAPVHVAVCAVRTRYDSGEPCGGWLAHTLPCPCC